jgi:hypothetical protein
MSATNFKDLIFTFGYICKYFRIFACMDMGEPIDQGWVVDNFSLQKFVKSPILRIKI